MTTFNPEAPNHYAYRSAFQSYVQFYGADGVTPIDPATVTHRFRDPKGQTTIWVYGTDPQIERLGVGQYQIDEASLPDTAVGAAGIWSYEWAGTGLNRVAMEGYVIVDSTAFL